MKPLRVSGRVVPIEQFKKQAERWLRHVTRSGEPVVITLSGRPTGVLLSPAEFDRLEERHRFLESVAAGLTDADAGRVMSTKDLRRRLAEKRAQGRPD